MNAVTLSRPTLRLRVEALLARYSVWPVLCVLALLVGAAFTFAAHKAVKSELAREHAQLARLIYQSAAPAVAPQGPAQPAVPATWDALPTSLQQTADLRKLFDLARQRGFAVAQADYQHSIETGAAVEGMHVNVPLAGTYPQLRRYAEDALRALPHLAIDQIGFERPAIDSSALTARLKLSLWYRTRGYAAGTVATHEVRGAEGR